MIFPNGKKIWRNTHEVLLSRKFFFPKNYLLWICLYYLIEMLRPTSNNPFSIEPHRISHNETFIILLIFHPLLVFIDTYSLAQFLKQKLVSGNSILLLSLAGSFVLFYMHMIKFDHFGDDGLMNSIFFGLSYFFVIVIGFTGFKLGSRILSGDST